MTVLNLLSERRKTHYKKMSRYTKYVFNDHFVIVMLFIFGALAYQYAEFLKTVEPPFTTGKLVWLVLLSALIFFGKLTTLVEAADSVFLAAKEADWQAYLKKVRLTSMIVPASILLLVLGIAMPMIDAGQEISPVRLVAFYGILLLLKWLELGIQLVSLQMPVKVNKQRLGVLLFLLSLSLLATAFFINEWVGLGLAAVLSFLINQWLLKEEGLINWSKVVDHEEKRSANINRLINLFTDVPTVKNHAKRRKYLDSIVRFLAGKNNANQYLYARIFVRGGNYGGMFVRLTAIGMIIFMVTNLPIISLALNVLFIYLTGFQLFSLYDETQENILVRLYPESIEQKDKGFKDLLVKILLAQSLLFAFATTIGINIAIGGTALVLNGLFSYLFIHFYFSKRSKRRSS